MEVMPWQFKIILMLIILGRSQLNFHQAYSFISNFPKEECFFLQEKMTMHSTVSSTVGINSKKFRISTLTELFLIVGLDKHYITPNSTN